MEGRTLRHSLRRHHKLWHKLLHESVSSRNYSNDNDDKITPSRSDLTDPQPYAHLGPLFNEDSGENRCWEVDNKVSKCIIIRYDPSVCRHHLQLSVGSEFGRRTGISRNGSYMILFCFANTQNSFVIFTWSCDAIVDMSTTMDQVLWKLVFVFHTYIYTSEYYV